MLKLYVKLFVPQIIFILKELVLGIISKFRMVLVRYDKVSIKESKLIVIGNGPSFNDTYNNYFEEIKNTVCVVVNNFVNSSFFEQIRPKYYLIVDYHYFLPISVLSDRIKTDIETLQSGLINKVKWPINVLLPISARGSDFQKKILENKNIKISFFNNKGTSNVFPNNRLKFFLWNHEIISPLAQTVLNTAISLAIKNRVPEIYLVGADTSWHENYELDQETNVLYCKDTHFYGNRKIPMYQDVENKVSIKIHTELQSASIALGSYWILHEYSLYNKVNVYNASAYSWIDAFERKKIKDNEYRLRCKAFGAS